MPGSTAPNIPATDSLRDKKAGQQSWPALTASVAGEGELRLLFCVGLLAAAQRQRNRQRLSQTQ